ncbi:phage holin family protein [Paenibacillus alvei]|uniref:phage holin family protein n=1 Tax=Paenibacillus alvei TaxID=44250 RepID=UPI003083B458
MSIVENGGRLGVPVPNVLRKAIMVLKDKGSDGDDSQKRDKRDNQQEKDDNSPQN